MSGQPQDRSLRLALVTRRYWPQSGPSERFLSALTAAWARQGHSTVVITSGWGQGPSRFVEDGVEVVRLSSPRSSLWSGNSYLRELNRTLRELKNDIDLIVVDGLDRELSTTAKSIHTMNTPLVVRYEQDAIRYEPGGSSSPQRLAKAVDHAAAFVAANATALAELKSKGLPAAKLHLIKNPLPEGDDIEENRYAARVTLAKTHVLFNLPVGGKLGLYIGPLTREHGLFELINAWKTIGEKHPSARLWIIGEGKDGPELWRRTVEANLEEQVIFPGVFDDSTDLLRAADFVLQPSQCDTGLETAAAAASHGNELIVSDLPEIRASLSKVDEDRVHLTPPNDLAALTRKIETVLGKLTETERTLSSAPSANLNSQWNPEDRTSFPTADQYIALFQKLVSLNSAN